LERAERFVWNFLRCNWLAALKWIVATDKTKLACASDLHWLVRENTAMCWATEDYEMFIAELVKFWNNGGA
jgi:hypothetical protein